MKTDDIAIIVPSCDKFSDLWNPFYSFFFKYWPDCPFKIYHLSDYKICHYPNVTSMPYNCETDWSTGLKHILNQIEQDYVIIILEDYFIYKPVDTIALLSALEIMEKHNAFFLKIFCWPTRFNVLWKYKKLDDEPLIGIIDPKAKYKISTQIGAWNKKLLIEILKEGETIREFEKNGNQRAQVISNLCLCIVEDPTKNHTHGPITYLCTAVTKGVWMRDAIELCKKENVPLQITSRKIETKFEYFFRRLYTISPLSIRKYLDFIRRRILKFQY